MRALEVSAVGGASLGEADANVALVVNAAKGSSWPAGRSAGLNGELTAVALGPAARPSGAAPLAAPAGAPLRAAFGPPPSARRRFPSPLRALSLQASWS